MLNFIIVLYAAVALLGIYLLIKILNKKPSKMLTGVIHGSLGLIGLALLIGYISFQREESPVYGFLFLLMAFFIGSGMLATFLTGKKYPVILLMIHILFALTGLYLLYEFWLNKI